jgi:D-ribose pyranose/furanose isomerase RbsD
LNSTKISESRENNNQQQLQVQVQVQVQRRRRRQGCRRLVSRPPGRTEIAVDEVAKELEETTTAVAVGQSRANSNLKKKEASRSASSTSTTTTTAGMQKIDEGNEEEEEILGMKTRNWRKINLSFAIELNGQEGEDIRTDYMINDKWNEGNNEKMKHHPIMSKLANFIVAVEKKCNTVKVMSSKKKMVLDSKVCMDSWSINEVKSYFAFSIVKNRQRNVQVTLYIEYGNTSTLWRMKNKVFEIRKTEGIWIVNHNGPIEVVETTQIGFFAGVHPDLYRKGWEEEINRRISDYYDKNKANLILRAHEIPELKEFLGPIPDIQIIPLNITGMKIVDGKNQKALLMGISVPNKLQSLLKYILHAISEEMEIEYVDFTMKYDQQKKVLCNKLVRCRQEFMHNHNTVNIHCMEREEMKKCRQELIGIPSVIACDETVITERNGTWVLVMKYNNQTGFEQKDLNKIDSIIANNPLMKDRKLQRHPFRKKQPVENLNLTALSGQEN